jgi:peptidoglycan/xylan/chitin deacetylase (PgdA/CDA1 family)
VALAHAAKRRTIRHAAACASTLLGRRAEGWVGILMYHRVTDRPAGTREPTWNVTPRRFRRQMAGLLSRGYRPWPLRQVIEHGRRRQALPPRVFVVTFDDGYESVHRNAWPILRELGISATVFLPTAYIDRDTPFPFDDWQAAGSSRVPAHAWRLMSVLQCRELAADGLVELGAHTHTHCDFRGQPTELAVDLSRCVEAMQTWFGVEEPTFAFPFGYAGPALADAARRCGVLCALTARERLVDPASDPFDWGRFEVSQADSATTLAACLGGWCDAIRQGRLRKAVSGDFRKGQPA